MKTRYFAAAALFAALSVSCKGDYEAIPETSGTVTLSVSLGGPLTKVLRGNSDTADMSFHNAQIFVYNNAGKLEAKSGPVTRQDGIELSVIAGTKTIWALVNAPQLDLGIGSSETPEAKVSLLSDNTPASLVMSGCKLNEPVGSDKNVSVQVKHIAAKVVLDKIVRQFTDANLSEVPMKLKKIYMSNVAADCSYGCDGYTPAQWNCKMGVLSSPAENAALLLDDGLDADLDEGDEYNTAHTFYVYPNPTAADSESDSWCERKTRLVLECDYNGRTAYYPVTIKGAGIERNKVYHISELALKRPGSVKPDSKEPQVSSDVTCTFDITVADWETETPYTEEF